MKAIKSEDLMTLQNNERIWILQVNQGVVVIQALTNTGWLDPETGSYVILEEGSTDRVKMVS